MVNYEYVMFMGIVFKDFLDSKEEIEVYKEFYIF